LEYKQKFNVILFGLGNIGLGYDINSDNEKIFTHSKAFLTHPGFNLSCGIDIKEERRNEFKAFTHKPAYSRLKHDIGNLQPTIIVIATPPSERLELLKSCLHLKPSLIVMEKPLASSIEDGKKIVKLCKSKNVRLFVNYIRRCEPSIQKIKNLIDTRQFGELGAAHIYYSGGTFENGSHFIDLILFWFGDPLYSRLISGNNNSQYDGDPSLNFMLNYRNADCIFQTVSELEYSIAAVDLIFKKGRVQVEDFGRQVKISKGEHDPDFRGYFRLNHSPDLLSNRMHKYQWNVVDHLYRHLTEGITLLSTGQSALNTLQICEHLKSEWINHTTRKS